MHELDHRNQVLKAKAVKIGPCHCLAHTEEFALHFGQHQYAFKQLPEAVDTFFSPPISPNKVGNAGGRRAAVQLTPSLFSVVPS